MARILDGLKSWIAQDRRRVAIVAAFDSWLTVANINRGLSDERLLTQERGAGLIPGEAASAVVVQADEGLFDGTYMKIAGVGLADEAASFTSGRLGAGVGLSKAIRAALAESGAEANEINLRLANVTGEDYFFVESSYAWTRVLRQLSPLDYRYQIIDSAIGSVGSAFGPLGIGHAMQRSEFLGKNQKVLLQLSSAGPSRSAIVGEIVEGMLEEIVNEPETSR